MQTILFGGGGSSIFKFVGVKGGKVVDILFGSREVGFEIEKKGGVDIFKFGGGGDLFQFGGRQLQIFTTCEPHYVFFQE